MISEIEILNMINKIDNSINVANDEEKLEYFGNVKASLYWILQKISIEHKQSNIEDELKEIADKTCIDELEEDAYKAFMDFMNIEFNGLFNGRDPYTVCNVADTIDWVLGQISTKQFLSEDYLKIE